MTWLHELDDDGTSSQLRYEATVIGEHSMRLLLFAAVFSALGLVVPAAPADAQTRGVPASEIVFLVSDCADSGHVLGTDCFQDLASLQGFIGAGRMASAPLVVDVGPGTFQGSLSLTCSPGEGHVTFRGMGRDRSILKGVSATTVSITDCEQLGFHDLTIEAPSTAQGNVLAAAFWSGCGSSTFTDVDLVVRGATPPPGSSSAAWWDDFDQCQAIHYWFGSRIFNEGDAALTIGFYVASDQHWVYGGDIKVEGSTNTPSPAAQVAVYTVESGEMRIYGSTVRALVGGATNVDYNSYVTSIVGVTFDAIVNLGAIVHMHGGIIVSDASASQLPVNVEGAENAVHVNDTSFNVVAGPGGTATRLKARFVSPSHVKSPFQWPPGANPPNVVSLTGSDTFVETDCSATGNCEGGDQTHLMIYNDAACPTERWFDSTTGRCRNDSSDPLADIQQAVTDIQQAVSDLEARVEALENP